MGRRVPQKSLPGSWQRRRRKAVGSGIGGWDQGHMPGSPPAPWGRAGQCVPTRAGLCVYQECGAQVVCAGLRCGCRVRLPRRMPVPCAIHRPHPAHGVLRCHVPRRVPCGVCCAALAATPCCVGPAAAACALGCVRGRRRLGVQREVVKWVAWAGGGCVHESDTGAGAACAAGSTITPRVCVCIHRAGRDPACADVHCACMCKGHRCAHTGPPHLAALCTCVHVCACTHTSAWLQEGTGADAGAPGRSGACQDGAWAYAGGTHGLRVGKSIRPCPGRMRVHAQAGACGLGACVHRRAGVCAGDVCAREAFARAAEVLVHGRWLRTGDGCAREVFACARQVFVHRRWSCAGDVCAHASVPA